MRIEIVGLINKYVQYLSEPELTRVLKYVELLITSRDEKVEEN